MIYKFLILSNEQEAFKLKISIDSDASFLDFHNIIMKAVGYSSEELTSFFICSDNWEREQEITRIDMCTDTSVDSYIMESTYLSDFIDDEGQRMQFVFDMLTDRALFIELVSLEAGQEPDGPKIISMVGNPPKQNMDFDDTFNREIDKVHDGLFDDDNQYESDSYSIDEIDIEGFSDFSFDN